MSQPLACCQCKQSDLSYYMGHEFPESFPNNEARAPHKLELYTDVSTHKYDNSLSFLHKYGDPEDTFYRKPHDKIHLICCACFLKLSEQSKNVCQTCGITFSDMSVAARAESLKTVQDQIKCFDNQAQLASMKPTLEVSRNREEAPKLRENFATETKKLDYFPPIQAAPTATPTPPKKHRTWTISRMICVLALAIGGLAMFFILKKRYPASLTQHSFKPFSV